MVPLILKATKKEELEVSHKRFRVHEDRVLAGNTFMGYAEVKHRPGSSAWTLQVGLLHYCSEPGRVG